MRDYFAEQSADLSEAPVCPIVKSLAGQKALVTGANSGIGRAIAVALGHAGADVVVNYVSREEEAQEVVQEVRRCGARAYAHRADVSSEAEVDRMFGTMTAEFGTVDYEALRSALKASERPRGSRRLGAS